jgi:hypothetical protein
MDRIDKFRVRAEAWLNKRILRMNDEANKAVLLDTFSGSISPSIDREFQEYVLTLFPS